MLRIGPRPVAVAARLLATLAAAVRVERMASVAVTESHVVAATDNPTMAVSYIKNPEDAYTSLATITETTNKSRQKIPLRVSSDAVGLKLVQSNASSDTRIYALEAEVSRREGSRLT